MQWWKRVPQQKLRIFLKKKNIFRLRNKNYLNEYGTFHNLILFNCNVTGPPGIYSMGKQQHINYCGVLFYFYLSIYLSIDLLIYLFIYLFTYLFMYFSFIYLFTLMIQRKIKENCNFSQQNYLKTRKWFKEYIFGIIFKQPDNFFCPRSWLQINSYIKLN